MTRITEHVGKKKKGQKTAVIVLGAPRSGTSAVSHVISKLGVNFGDEARFVDPAIHVFNPIFFELKSLNRLNDEIIAALGYSYVDFDWLISDSSFSDSLIDSFEERVRSLLAEEFGDCQLIGLKDPRFCVTLPVWQKLLGRSGYEIKYVWAVRDLASSLESNMRASGNSNSAQQLRLVALSSLLAGYFLEGKRPHLLSYSDLLKFPTKVITTLAQRLGARSSLVPAACSVIDPSLNHGASHNQSLPRFVEQLSNKLVSGQLTRKDYEDYRENLASAGFFELADKYRENLASAGFFQLADKHRHLVAEVATIVDTKDRYIADLSKIIEDSREAIHNLEANYDTSQVEINRLTAIIADQDQSPLLLEQIKSAVAASHTDARISNELANELRLVIADQRAELLNKSKELAESKLASEKIQALLTTATTAAASMQQLNCALELQLEHSEANVVRLRAIEEHLRAQLLGVALSNDSQKKEIAAYELEVTALKTEVQSKCTLTDGLTRDNAGLTAALDEQVRITGDLASALATAQQTEHSLRDRLISLEACKAKLEADVLKHNLELSAHRDEAQTTRAFAESLLKDKAKFLEAIQEKVLVEKSLLAVLDSLKENERQLAKHIINLESRNKIITTDVLEAKLEANAAQEDARTERALAESLTSDNAHLRKSLQEQVHAANELNANLDDALVKIHALEKTNAHLESIRWSNRIKRLWTLLS